MKPARGVATNNHEEWFDYKVTLRIQSIEHLVFARVLECFAGEGKLWDAVEQKSGKKIYRFKIDANFYPGIDIIGDSEKVLKRISLKRFNVIDLDAWGSPVKHLDILFKKQFKGIVHCTYCTPCLFTPVDVLAETFYEMDKKIFRKAPALFAKRTEQQFEKYLITNGIKEVTGHFSKKRNYFYFGTI